jgi:hypothetical protein
MRAEDIEVTYSGLPSPESLFSLIQHAVAHGHLPPWTFVQRLWPPSTPPSRERIIELTKSGNSIDRGIRWDATREEDVLSALNALRLGYDWKVCSSIGARQPLYEECLNRVRELLDLPTPAQVAQVLHAAWTVRCVAFAQVDLVTEISKRGDDRTTRVASVSLDLWKAPRLTYAWTRVGLLDLVKDVARLNAERVAYEMSTGSYGEINTIGRRLLLGLLSDLYRQLGGVW